MSQPNGAPPPAGQQDAASSDPSAQHTIVPADSQPSTSDQVAPWQALFSKATLGLHVCCTMCESCRLDIPLQGAWSSKDSIASQLW